MSALGDAARTFGHALLETAFDPVVTTVIAVLASGCVLAFVSREYHVQVAVTGSAARARTRALCVLIVAVSAVIASARMPLLDVATGSAGLGSDVTAAVVGAALAHLLLGPALAWAVCWCTAHARSGCVPAAGPEDGTGHLADLLRASSGAGPSTVGRTRTRSPHTLPSPHTPSFANRSPNTLPDNTSED